MKVYYLNYDIPDNSGVPNPSSELYRRGVRVNWSVWAIPEDTIPWSLLNGWPASVVWHCWQFAEHENQKIAAAGHAMIRLEMDRRVASIRESEQHYARRLRAGEITTGRYESAMRAVVKGHETWLADAATGAGRFGVTFQADALRAGMRDIRANSRTRAREYIQLAREAAEQAANGTGNAGLAAAARDNEVPASVLLDHVEEAGGNVDSARQVFTEFAQPTREDEEVAAEHARMAEEEEHGDAWEPEADRLPVAVATAPPPVRTVNGTWARLRDTESWGARTTTPVSHGDQVRLTNRAGVTVTRTVSYVVWSGNGVWLSALAD